MFCQKCGAELPEGALFCAQCGTNQASFEQADTGSTMQGSTADQQNLSSAGSVHPGTVPGFDAAALTGGMKDKLAGLTGKVNTKYLGMAGIAVILVIVICIIAGNAGKRVDLNDYYTVTFEGYDTRGRAAGEFDVDAFYTKYRKVLKKHKVSKKEAADVVGNLYEVKIDKASELSNGDEVKVEWDIKEEKFTKKLGLKSKTKEKTYTVEGLEEIETFDAFDGIDLEFTGMSPNGSAKVTGNTGENGLDYSIEKNGSLSNGDKVKVVVSYGWGTEDRYIEENGRIPEEMSKEFTVEGLDEYLSKYEDIPADLIDKMKKDAEDEILAYTTKSYNENTKMSGLEYAGYVFRGTKPDGDYWWSSVNGIYLVYRGTVTGEPGKLDATTVYYPVWFSTLAKKGGETSYDSCGGIQGSCSIGNAGIWTNGYSNPVLLYAEEFTDGKENYNVQSGDGMEVYADYTKVSDLASINPDALSSFENKAIDLVQRFYDEKFENQHIENLVVTGEYLLVAKEQSGKIENDNRLYIVVSGTATSDEGSYEPTTVYFPVRYDRLSGDANGKFYYEKCEGIRGTTDLPSGWTSIPGYTDGSAMYDDIITKNRDNFSYEVTEGLKQFGQ